jgi:hypothetical protein
LALSAAPCVSICCQDLAQKLLGQWRGLVSFRRGHLCGPGLPGQPAAAGAGRNIFSAARNRIGYVSSARSTLKDDGAAKLVLYKGKPVTYQGQLLFEHEYSDHLMIKLLEI